MSVQAMQRVFEAELSDVEFRALMALADHADPEGGSIFPSIELTAWKIGKSPRQTKRIVLQLRQDGKIELVRAAHRTRPNEYRIIFEALTPKPALERGVNEMPRGMREDVIAGGDQKCALCDGRGDVRNGPDGRPWAVERVVSASAGGRFEWGNVRLACWTCNHDRTVRLRGAMGGTPPDGTPREAMLNGTPGGATQMAPEPSVEPPEEPSGFAEWLDHHIRVTGNKAMSVPGTKARAEVEAAYRERRREYPDEDLRLVSLGAMGHPYRRAQGYTSAQSVLRPSAFSELLERGRQRQPAQSDWQGDALLERTRRQYPPQREDALDDTSHEPPGGSRAAPPARDPGSVDDARGDAGYRPDRPAPG